MSLGSAESTELSKYLALPIPDYLAPPGVIITHDERGGHIVFEPDFKIEGVVSNPEWVDRIRRFLVNRYPKLEDKVGELEELSHRYTGYLAGLFQLLKLFYEHQTGLVANLNWEDANDMNQPGGVLSIPDTIRKMSFEMFLPRHLAQILTKQHPNYRRMSSTEQALAFDVVDSTQLVSEPTIEIQIRDSKVYEMMQANNRLEQNMIEALSNKTPEKLLDLYFRSLDDPQELAINLVSNS